MRMNGRTQVCPQLLNVLDVAARHFLGLVPAAILLIGVTISTNAVAQYLYLDANGDGINTDADQLQPIGIQTPIDVYLDTGHNADGSPTLCATGSEAMTINSYEFIISAAGGVVSYAGFTNHQLAFDAPAGSASNETDFYAGQVGSTTLPPGLYDLASVTVTVESGAPSLSPVASTELGGTYGTSFGSQCPGVDQVNTLRLGLDWQDTGGCGPPGGGNAAPANATAPQVTIVRDQPVGLVTEFSDLNQDDSLAIRLDGLPPGLVAVEGAKFDGRKQVRIYGLLDRSVPDDVTKEITWTATDGRLSTVTTTRIEVRPSPTVDEQSLRARVEDLLSRCYSHGMSNPKARELGARALPILSSMLRDSAYRNGWALVAQAIGAIGDTAYFDTLRAFVWTRFRGPVDPPTAMAIGIAQAALSTIATTSPRALQYLISSMRDSAWDDLPWRLNDGSFDDQRDMMARENLVALSYTDAPGASDALASLAIPSDTTSIGGSYRLNFVRGVTRVHARVRNRGFLDLWREQDAKHTGRRQ